MKKNIIFGIVYFLTVAVVIFNISCRIKDNLFSDIDKLPTGDMISQSTSPNEERRLNVYRVSNSIGVAVRVEMIEDSVCKNIFWQTGADNADIEWMDDASVTINQIPLNIGAGDTYDCRRGISLFQSGALAENNALISNEK